jgi:AcrR family transcriptional regulator
MDVAPTEQSTSKACKRAEIVTAAVRIADAEGVDAVSMRRLADELGVATMTPYTHVSSKDELLDLMRDAVAAEMLLPEPLPEDWRAALRAIAERTRAAYEAHPWSLDATPRRPRARINRLRHVEQSIGIVLRLGLPAETSRAVLLSIDDYVIGYCTRARARQRMLDSLGPEGKDALRHLHDPDPEVAAALDAGELPIIKKIAGRRDRHHPFGIPPDSGFEPGLDWLLDGVEASVARAASPAAIPSPELDGLDELEKRLARAHAEDKQPARP